MAKTNFQSIDEYIATFPQETQECLEQIRELVVSAVPDAKEKISYQMAAFELDGKDLIYFAGWKNHISIYPIPAGGNAFNKAITPYTAGKGTLKFPLDKPLPLELIRKIVQLHVSGNRKKAYSSLRARAVASGEAMTEGNNRSRGEYK